MGFHSVLDHVKAQEIPEVQVTERIQEQIVPERIEEQIGDIPVPPIVDETVEVVQVIPHERLQQRTVVPQIQKQIIENVQVIPRELFREHFDERIVDFAVPPTERDTGYGVVLTRRCPCSACSCERVLGLSNRVCVILIFRCPCSAYQRRWHY